MPTYSGFPIPGASPGTSKQMSIPPSSMAHQRQKFFADIRLPYSNFGPSANNEASSSSPSQSAPYSRTISSDNDNDAGVRATGADVRDFPQIMRQISKAKRMESLASKRKQGDNWGAASSSMQFAANPGMMMPPSNNVGMHDSSAWMSQSSSTSRHPYSSHYWGDGSAMQQNHHNEWNSSFAASSSNMNQGFTGTKSYASGAGSRSFSGMARLPPSPGPSPPMTHHSPMAGNRSTYQSYRQMDGNSTFGSNRSDWMQQRQQWDQGTGMSRNEWGEYTGGTREENDNDRGSHFN